MPKPEEYIAIQVWGAQSGSYAYYIKEQQARAAAVNAPLDAIFEETGPGGVRTGRWHTVSGLVEGHSFRAAYERALRAAGRTS